MPEKPEKPWTHHRARVANAVLRGDEEAADDARRDLKAARAEEYIKRLVDEAPALSADQRLKIAALIRPDLPVGIEPARTAEVA